MTPDAPPAELPTEASPQTVAAHADSTRKWRRYQRAKYWAVGVGAILLVLTAVALIVLTTVILAQNDKIIGLSQQVVRLTSETHDNAVATQQAVQILIDCTTPGHSCYDKGQQATRTAVEGLNAAANARELCAHDPLNDTIEKMVVCVTQKLAGR